MEGAAGTAGRVADACAWLVANPGGMAPHDMELEPARLVGGVLDGLSAAAVTAAAALDDSEMAAASRPEPVANGRRATSVQFLHGHSIRLKCRHFAVRRRMRRRGKGRSRRGAGEWPAPDRLGIVADASPALCGAVTRACLSETYDSAVRTLACRGDRHVRHPGAAHLPGHRQPRPRAARPPARGRRDGRRGAAGPPGGPGGRRPGLDGAVGRPRRDGHRRGHRRRQDEHQDGQAGARGRRPEPAWPPHRLARAKAPHHPRGWKGGACRGADGSRRAAPWARRTGWPPCRRRTSGASGSPRPGGSRSLATAPSGSGGGWTPSRRPPGSRRGNARAAWTSTMRSGILRCSPSTRGSGTRAGVCGGWTV